MEFINHLRRLFAYDDWANREVLRGFAAAGDVPVRSLGLMGHILAVEHLWYARIQQEPPLLPVWPQLSLAECHEHADRLYQVWSRYLPNLDDGRLSASVNYRNSKGEPWTSSVQDILLQVVTHAPHHRGQIAADMRASGYTPAATDYILAVRQGLIK